MAGEVIGVVGVMTTAALPEAAPLFGALYVTQIGEKREWTIGYISGSESWVRMMAARCQHPAFVVRVDVGLIVGAYEAAVADQTKGVSGG